MPLIYHEGYSLGDGVGNNQLLKDTVGWTGKNLLKNKATTQTINGVTFTVNADKSVTVNGTATAFAGFRIADKNSFDYKDYIGETLILSGCPANGSISSYKLRYNRASGDYSDDYGKGLNIVPDTTYTDSWYIEIAISNGVTVSNLTFYPMLRRADILDDTYEPYHESVETMYEEEIHGVNLLPRFTLADLKAINTSGTWNNNVYTRNGITFTVDENTQTVSISSGTSTAYTNFRFNINLKELLKRDIPYTVNGMSNSIGRLFIYDRGADRVLSENHGGDSSFVIPSNRTFTNNIELIFDVNQNVTIQATTIRPMLRKADIEDSTYRPYNYQAIQNQLDARGVLGAKNLLPNNATSQTVNGVTFTVNSDGTITANGTATAVANFNISLSISDTLSCILNGCPSGGSDNSYRIGARYNNSGTLTYNYDTGSGCEINDISIVDRVFVQIASGQTVNNLVFKPMLRLASDPDDTYQPYAMTNRELTEKKINIADLKTVVSASSDFTDFKTRIASL